MITIFDRYVNIKNREGFDDCTEEKLVELSHMLTQYGIAHSFCLADAKEIKAIEDKGMEYCVTLMYEEDKEVALELIYMLWMKAHRNASDEDIKKAWTRKGIKESCSN